MGLEKRHDHTLQTKPQAGGVGHLTVRRLDAENLSKVILVIVERADGRAVSRVRRYRQTERPGA